MRITFPGSIRFGIWLTRLLALLCALMLTTACGAGGDELVSANIDAGTGADGSTADGASSSGGVADTGTTSSGGASDTGASGSSGAADIGTTSSSGASDSGTTSSGGADDAGATSSSGGGEDSGASSSADAGASSSGSSSGSGSDAGGSADAGSEDEAKICNPCSASSECISNSDKTAACVDKGASGAFCGATCKDASDCGDGYICSDVTSIEGIATKQCVRSKLAGECPCSKSATAAGLSTACFAVDPSGKVKGQCPGTRACAPQGLTKCSAIAPKPEICNGVDDDCNGTADDATCDDANPCTTDSCKGKDGCEHAPIASACNDGSACTQKDTCKDGKCMGEALTCDDGNSCTTDACDPAAGCTQTNAESACDDGNTCTEKDKCKDGACAAGAPAACDDKNDCTADSCDPKTGKCAHQAGGESCDDGDACTSNDACKDGTCAGAALTCDDGNPCTTDSCDKASGCAHKNHSDTCDDSNACTEKDSCQDGKCAGTEKVCDDNNPCTDDSCDGQSGCVAKANNANCDDGSKCTQNDGCKEGKCTGGAVKCDDNNPCTDDGCDLAKGCTTSDNNEVCSDGDACTKGDKCAAGTCKGEALKCDDGNSCTDDSCDKKDGCKHVNNTASCSDGNACTEKDACKDASCAAGEPRSCDDKNACTADSCSPSTGKCNHKTIAGCKGCKEDKQCDDGNPCVGNKCVAGKCENKTAADGAKCSDGNFCTVEDTCNKGACAPGKPNSCDDSNPCTNDSCDVKNAKCQHVARAAKSKCGEKVALTEYKCLKQSVYVRYAYPGCNGDQAKPICGTASATLHWTELKKVQDCKLPNVCHIEAGKGVCGPPKVPDLVIESLKTDKLTYKAGETVKLTWVVRNKGNGDAGASYLNFYTGTYATMTPGQYNKGGLTLPKIPAGKTLTGTRNVVLASSWTNRVLYVGAMADRFAKVPESNEDNNGKAVKINVQSAIDLWAHTSSRPSTYHHQWGSAHKWYWYVHNYGRATAGASTVKLYYSEDAKLDKQDVLLGSAAVGTVKYRQTLKGAINYKMPTGNAKPGIRYLIMFADADNKVIEGNENNNLRVYKIAYYGYHDLVATKIATTPTVIQRGSMKLQITAKQAGNRTSGTFYDRVYASKDTTLGKGDLLLATFTRKAIKAGASYGGTANISLYKQTAMTAGSWYIIYVTDQTNTHKEVNEKNNRAITKVTVVSMPNLRPYHLSSYSYAYQGDLRYFSSYDRNYGTATAGKYSVRHYLSTDNKIDKSDKVLKTQTITSLKPGAAVKVVSSWKVPIDQKPGVYYVITRSDIENTVKESNETDNVRVFKFTVLGRPDLTVVSMSVSSTNVTAGDTVVVKAVTKNIGGAKTGNFNDRLFFAHAPTTHPTYLKKTFGQPGLAAGATAKVSEFKFTIPATASTRAYYFTYYADAFRGIKESNEKNNTRVVKINVKGVPDLRSYQFQTKGSSFKAGNTVTIYGGVRNYGRGTAGAFRVGYYFSTDAKFDSNDKLIASVKRSSLKVGQNTAVHATAKLPSNLKSGTYYLYQLVDDLKQVAESNEKNNLRVYKITVAAAPDLDVTAVAVTTKPVKAGGYVQGEVTHANLGAASTGKGFSGAFYMSKDTKVGSDVLLGSNSFIALGAGKSEKATFKFALNSAITKGTWYLYYFVDSTNQIPEGDESNNRGWLKLVVE